MCDKYINYGYRHSTYHSSYYGGLPARMLTYYYHQWETCFLHTVLASWLQRTFHVVGTIQRDDYQWHCAKFCRFYPMSRSSKTQVKICFKHWIRLKVFTEISDWLMFLSGFSLTGLRYVSQKYFFTTPYLANYWICSSKKQKSNK